MPSSNSSGSTSSSYSSTSTLTSPTIAALSEIREVTLWGTLVSLGPVRETLPLYCSQSTYILGRDPSRSHFLIVSSLRISGKHCAIRVKKIKDGTAAFEIIDLSLNGTFVNGKIVGREKSRLIEDGDEIILGPPNYNVAFRFHEVPVPREVLNAIDDTEIAGLWPKAPPALASVVGDLPPHIRSRPRPTLTSQDIILTSLLLAFVAITYSTIFDG